MKNHPAALLFRPVLLAAALLLAPAALLAGDAPSADDALQQLARNGSVPVKHAGPHVQIGTFQIQVSTKLGAPSVRLPDGTWLYDHRRIAGSGAAGTLVVRFTGGRVSALTLATPAAVAALRAGSPQLLATK